MKKNCIPEGASENETEIIAEVAGFYDDPVAAAAILDSHLPRLRNKRLLEKLLLDERTMNERRVTHHTLRSVELLKFNLDSLLAGPNKKNFKSPTLHTPSLEDYDRVGELSGIMRESALYAAKKLERNEQFVIED